MTNPTEAAMLRPGGLAKELRRIREEAGLTGTGLAEKLGWTQPRISKIENGRQLPSEEDVRAFALGVGVDDATLQGLLELRSQANVISREWRHGQGQASIQREYDEKVRQSRVIRNAEITTVPGLLQTREYARYQALQAVELAGFDPAEIDAVLDAKARRQEVLYDANKRFEFVITEAALRLLYCPRDVMLAQLDRLQTLTYERENLWFGVVPFGVQLPLVPQNRFFTLDDVVLVEHFAGDESYRGERALTYHKVMDLMMAEAVTGEKARRLIVAAADALP